MPPDGAEFPPHVPRGISLSSQLFGRPHRCHESWHTPTSPPTPNSKPPRPWGTSSPVRYRPFRYGSNACPPNGAMGQNLVSIFLGTVYSARGSRRGSMSIILAVHHKHPLYFHNIRSNSQLQLPKMLQRLFASHAHPHRNVGYEADILFLACHQSCQRS